MTSPPKDMNEFWQRRAQGKRLVEVKASRLEYQTGDISNSYSADVISMTSTVRKPFKFEGREWTATSIGVLGSQRDTEAYKLTPKSQFVDGPLFTYTNVCQDDDLAESQRGSQTGFYHAMVVRRGKEEWVMEGPPVIFAAKGEVEEVKPRQLSLF